MLKIKLLELFVDDQDAARAFYTEKLGFEVANDVAYGPDARWLSVVAPDDRDGAQLLLAKAEGEAKAFQEARRAQGKPATSLHTDDIAKTHETLVARGVVFTTPPTRMDYGGTDAVFEDGCGNLVNLHQD